MNTPIYKEPFEIYQEALEQGRTVDFSMSRRKIKKVLFWIIALWVFISMCGVLEEGFKQGISFFFNIEKVLLTFLTIFSVGAGFFLIPMIVCFILLSKPPVKVISLNKEYLGIHTVSSSALTALSDTSDDRFPCILIPWKEISNISFITTRTARPSIISFRCPLFYNPSKEWDNQGKPFISFACSTSTLQKILQYEKKQFFSNYLAIDNNVVLLPENLLDISNEELFKILSTLLEQYKEHDSH